MKARMVLLWGTLVSAVWAPAAGAAVPCPPGEFIVRATKRFVPFETLFVDPTAGRIGGGLNAPTSDVRVRRTGGTTRIRARWSLSDSDSRWVYAVSVRSDSAHCDSIVGHAKGNRRLLRRMLGNRVPLRDMAPAKFRGDRAFDPTPPERPDCVNSQGGPALATLTVESGGDLDLGWTGLLHDVRVAGGRIAFCLDGCDASGESVCRATAASQVPYGPPVPALAAGLPLCLVPTVFGSTQTGRIDLATGAMNLPIRTGVSVHMTSSTAVCPRCEAGACTDGPSAGAPCTVDAQTVVHGLDGVDVIYPLSGDCLPGSGSLIGEIPIDLALTTATTSLAGSPPCFADSKSPPPDDACGEAGCGGSCTDGADIEEVCCVDAPDLACFPTRDGGAIIRTGVASAPSAEGGAPWPDPAYPKNADATVAAVSCADSSGSVTADEIVGLPGPVALRLPVALTVEKN